MVRIAGSNSRSKTIAKPVKFPFPTPSFRISGLCRSSRISFDTLHNASIHHRCGSTRLDPRSGHHAHDMEGSVIRKAVNPPRARPLDRRRRHPLAIQTIRSTHCLVDFSCRVPARLAPLLLMWPSLYAGAPGPRTFVIREKVRRGGLAYGAWQLIRCRRPAFTHAERATRLLITSASPNQTMCGFACAIPHLQFAE